MPDRQRGRMNDDHQTYINTIRPRATVLNERVVWEKTRVLVLQGRRSIALSMTRSEDLGQILKLPIE